MEPEQFMGKYGLAARTQALHPLAQGSVNHMQFLSGSVIEGRVRCVPESRRRIDYQVSGKKSSPTDDA